MVVRKTGNSFPDKSSTFLFQARELKSNILRFHTSLGIVWFQIVKRDIKKNIECNVTEHRTYLLTPWSRVLLEKLIGSQLVKKFPAFYGTRKIITAVTSARHLSLSWANSIQSTPPHPTSWRSILILSSHLRLGLPRHRTAHMK